MLLWGQPGVQLKPTRATPPYVTASILPTGAHVKTGMGTVYDAQYRDVWKISLTHPGLWLVLIMLSLPTASWEDVA